jgi:hypothetical protein
MRFPANCLVVAIVASCRRGSSLWCGRNKSGRLHFFWRDAAGRSWEFYTKGASTRSYLRNALTIGEIKRMVGK